MSLVVQEIERTYTGELQVYKAKVSRIPCSQGQQATAGTKACPRHDMRAASGHAMNIFSQSKKELFTRAYFLCSLYSDSSVQDVKAIG